MNRLEAHMIEPVRSLMDEHMGLDIIAAEFSAGYGIADLVGAEMCEENCQSRKALGIAAPLDHRHFIEILLTLAPGVRMPIAGILDNVSFSESTLRKRVLPRMVSYGLLEREPDDSVRLLTMLPKPTNRIVAIEVKQTKWREALLQARRYTFFADQSYVAVWTEITARVDRALLDRHKLGLIGVAPDKAEVLVKAPTLSPREPRMGFYCAEYLYRQALSS